MGKLLNFTVNSAIITLNLANVNARRDPVNPGENLQTNIREGQEPSTEVPFSYMYSRSEPCLGSTVPALLHIA